MSSWPHWYRCFFTAYVEKKHGYHPPHRVEFSVFTTVTTVQKACEDLGNSYRKFDNTTKYYSWLGFVIVMLRESLSPRPAPHPGHPPNALKSLASVLETGFIEESGIQSDLWISEAPSWCGLQFPYAYHLLLSAIPLLQPEFKLWRCGSYGHLILCWRVLYSWQLWFRERRTLSSFSWYPILITLHWYLYLGY